MSSCLIEALLVRPSAGVLREEGGFEYKKAIVQSILALIQDIPEAKETGLSHLCEFIEDCEFTYLSVQVLHLLGKSEGDTTIDWYARVSKKADTVNCSPFGSIV